MSFAVPEQLRLIKKNSVMYMHLTDLGLLGIFDVISKQSRMSRLSNFIFGIDIFGFVQFGSLGSLR